MNQRTQNRQAAKNGQAAPQVLGKLSPAAAARRLREQGEHEAAQKLAAMRSGGAQPKNLFGEIEWPFQDRAWQHTAHAFGYIPPIKPGRKLVPISYAGNIAADRSLRGKQLTITLNALRVADYPGGGEHSILLEFSAQNQAADGAQDLHFNATYRARSGEKAATVGFPIFAGLGVGKAGLTLRCYTVNVQNKHDLPLLDMFESDVFKAGLRLASAAQPAIGQLSVLASGLAKAMAERTKNVPVQDFALGLDFDATPGGLRLALGSYLAVQVPKLVSSAWDWGKWVYNPATGEIVSQNDHSQLIPYNYIMFGVSRYKA